MITFDATLDLRRGNDSEIIFPPIPYGNVGPTIARRLRPHWKQTKRARAAERARARSPTSAHLHVRTNLRRRNGQLSQNRVASSKTEWTHEPDPRE